MKKVLLIVALLLVVSPVMATVTITATQETTTTLTDGNYAATIRINYSGGSGDNNIRAFALDINTDNGCGFWNIRDFNVGENNSVKQGYGIFPGRFRAFVSPTSPNWVDTNYNPTPAYNDPGSSLTGIGYNKIITELGYLGAGDPNMPAKSGTLFRIDVNSYGVRGDVNLTIAADAMRGGIVSKDTNATLTSGTNLPYTTLIHFPTGCTTPTNEVGQTTATALAAWGPTPGQGFTNIVGTPVVNCANVGLVITNDQNCISTSTQLNYTYGIRATEPNIAGKTMTDANNTIIATGLTVGTITYEPNGLRTALRVDRQSPAAGTVTCSAVNYVVDTNCLYVGRVFTTTTGTLTVTQTMVNYWNYLGQPNCWCCASQKRGNGVYSGSSGSKVDSADLGGVKNASAWMKSYNQAGYLPCLDFNLSGKIDSADLGIVKNANNWMKTVGAGPPCQ